MLNQLCFIICWYDDPGIIRTLKSLPDESEKIVIDGVFKGYDEASPPLSTDELRDIVLSTSPNTKIIDAPNHPEHIKRDIGLYAASHYKYAFSIDSDEWLRVSNWGKFFNSVNDLPSGFMHVLEDFGDGSMFATPKVIIHPKDWMYYKAHCIFKNKRTGELSHNPSNSDVFLDEDTIIIGHDDSLRSPLREHLSKDYEKYIIKQELPIRTDYANNNLI